MYTSLDPDQIISTVERLERRISERFPNRGLRNVCGELSELSSKAKERAVWIARPHTVIRVSTLVIVGVILVILLTVLLSMAAPKEPISILEFAQTLEAAINDVILIGALVFFLITLETRVKRHRALKALHELRSLAHVIDMHQLSKDPERNILNLLPTPSSPDNDLSMHELSRYLDYCSEMLSLIGKLAATYVQDFDDSVVLSAVNEIETLTSGMSRKIWQKIMIINNYQDSRASAELQLTPQ